MTRALKVLYDPQGRKDDAVDFSEGADAEWQEFFNTYQAHACPSCVRRKAMHCPHVAKWKAGAKVAHGGTAAEKRAAIKAALWEEVCNDTSAVEELAAIRARAQAGE